MINQQKDGNAEADLFARPSGIIQRNHTIYGMYEGKKSFTMHMFL